jgi:hypothetical protein
MIANRRRPCRTSNLAQEFELLAARSIHWSDRPVRLPPGRARLAMRLAAIGSTAIAKTIGMTDVVWYLAEVPYRDGLYGPQSLILDDAFSGNSDNPKLHNPVPRGGSVPSIAEKYCWQ